MNKLKIGLISTPLLKVFPDNYGGLEAVVGDLAEALAEKGHDVTVFAPNGSRVKGCKVVECGDSKGTVQCDCLDAEQKMYEVYKDQLSQFDIVHGHNHFGFEYLAKCKNPALKVCHTHHGGIYVEWWNNVNWGKKHPTSPFKMNFISISKWMQYTYYKCNGIESMYVYNGVNPNLFSMRKTKGDRLLFVGRFDAVKQPHLAIAVAKKLNMGLDLVGGTCGIFVEDKRYLANLETMCDGKQIKMFKDVSHEEKVKFYQNAKCTLFLSKMGEPFGLISPESMMCGTPVIGTNDGAIPETIKEGGVICTDVDSIIDAIKNIVPKINPADCRKNAERFTRSIMAENYLLLYKSILCGQEW